MESLSSWAEMGGYASYVWPSFGAAFIVLSALVGASLYSLKRTERQLSRLHSK